MQPFALNLETLAQWCVRQKLTYMVQEPSRMIVVPRGPGEAPIRLIDRADRGMCTLAIGLPVQAPEARRAELARAVTLLNSSSFMGAWVVNQSTGETYFRVTVPTRGVSWSDEGVMYLVQVLIGTFDAAAPALQGVLSGERAWDTVMPRP